MEMVAGLLKAATQTFGGSSRGEVGAGDDVTMVGGAVDDERGRWGKACRPRPPPCQTASRADAAPRQA
jgi:hypothetical protein